MSWRRLRSGIAKPGGELLISGHASLPTGLLYYWPLDEASGTRAAANTSYDLTDNNTVTSAAAGPYNSSADFEANNSEYLSATNIGSVAAGAYSVCAWLRAESLAGAQATWGQGFIKNRSGETAGYFMASVNQSGAVQYYDFGRTRRDSSTGVITVGNDHFVVFGYDGSTQKIYVDGVDVTSGTGALSNGWTPSELAIGRLFNGAGYYWDGLIWGVGIWSKMLSADERIFLYNGGAGRKY